MFEREARQVCAACGAGNALDANFCGVCGQALPGETEAPIEDKLPMESSALARHEFAGQTSAGIEGAERMFEAPEGQIAQKRCSWCSNLSAWTAEVCEHCGAHFPVPEQDEAFRRAAEERMRQDLESLQFMSRRRKRGWRRWLI